MLNLYNWHILPLVTHKICSASPVKKQREKVVPLADGRVLEIGVGSGHNIPFYDIGKVDHLFALDPSSEMWKIAQRQINLELIPTEFLLGGSEQIPLDDETVDSILITFTLWMLPSENGRID